MTSPRPAARPAPWVVVGLDNGGTANNATVLTSAGDFLVDRLVEVPSRVVEGTAVAVEAMVEALETVLGDDRRRAVRSPRRRAGHPRPGQRRRRHLLPRRHQLLRPRVVGLRRPRCAGGQARAARRLQQRRQRGRALRPPRALRRRLDPPVVGLGDRGDRARRRRGRSAARSSAGAAGMAGELGHVQIPMAGLLEPDQPIAAVQLRQRWRRGERGLADRHREEPAALLALAATPTTRSPVRSSSTAAKSVRGLAAGGDELALKVFAQQATALGRLFTPGRELHRPARLLRGRRGGRGRAGTSGTGSSAGSWTRPTFGPSSGRVATRRADPAPGHGRGARGCCRGPGGRRPPAGRLVTGAPSPRPVTPEAGWAGGTVSGNRWPADAASTRVATAPLQPQQRRTGGTAATGPAPCGAATSDPLPRRSAPVPWR